VARAKDALSCQEIFQQELMPITRFACRRQTEAPRASRRVRIVGYSVAEQRKETARVVIAKTPRTACRWQKLRRANRHTTGLREWKLHGSLWPKNRTGLTASNYLSLQMKG
jgi:hypothetical protein